MRTSFVIAVLLIAGCIDEPCDPGQRLAKGLCSIAPADARPTLEDPPDGAATDAGPTLEDTPDAAASVPVGATCAATADCGGATNLCAIQPPAPTGFCTHDGCLEDPSVCPEGTTCIDVGAYSPGLSLCI